MEIKLTIGVTPTLEKILIGLTAFTTHLSGGQGTPSQPVIQNTAPVQPVQPAPVTPVAVPTQPVGQAAPVSQQPTQGVPTSTPGYSMDQLAVAATQLVDGGKRDDLLGLLASFGVQALTELPKEQYGNFATQLRGMGAKI